MQKKQLIPAAIRIPLRRSRTAARVPTIYVAVASEFGMISKVSAPSDPSCASRIPMPESSPMRSTDRRGTPRGLRWNKNPGNAPSRASA